MSQENPYISKDGTVSQFLPSVKPAMGLPHGFKPVTVQADSDELADQGERLLIYFPRRWQPGDPVDTRIAAIGIVTAGWVVGVK